MEKNMKLPSGSTEPSAPPPMAPPSYEEAVENATRLPRHPNIPPYPVGPSSMPIPIQNQPPSKTTLSPVPPYPPVYSGPSHSQTQTQAQPNENPSAVPGPKIRVVYQPVLYSLTSTSTKTICPTCHTSIKTNTVSDHQLSAHICCIILCLLGCFLCSCLPYYMSNFKTVHHFCPKCKNYIGIWKG